MEEGSLISHLLELRDRLLRSVIVLLVLFIPCALIANELYEFLAKPLMEQLPQGTTMIATEPHAPFFVPFKFAFAVAFAIAIPYLLYQIWAFVAPGLYRHEKRMVFPLMVSSSALFYLGIAFSYFVVFPLIFKFFTASAPEGVAVMTDISSYLGFVLKLFFAFGIAFEVPIATILLVKIGITTPDALAEKRPYVIIGAFVLGMLLTPPDIFSQTLLAIPVWILFEVGLFASRRFVNPAEDDEPEEELDMDAEFEAAEKELDALDNPPKEGP